MAATASAKADEAIRERRRRLRLTQQQLAIAAACSLSAVRLYESGYSPAAGSPTRDRVEAVLTELERRSSARL
jgi:transcriptional regulator with XRE-family HTH domain